MFLTIYALYDACYMGTGINYVTFQKFDNGFCRQKYIVRMETAKHIVVLVPLIHTPEAANSVYSQKDLRCLTVAPQ